MRSFLFALISAVLIAQAASAAGQPKVAALAGTWQTVKIDIAGANPRTISVPQPAPYLTIFTAKHYSRTEIQSEGPRAALADASKATADELRAAWGPVIAEAGTYEIRGETLTFHPLASKSPAAMAPGALIECTFKLNGNTLTIAQVRNQAGPYPNPVTFTLTRIE